MAIKGAKKLHQLTFFYMNTNIDCLLYCEADQLMMLGPYIDRYFAKIERKFSRFIEESELSKINHSPGKRIDISEEMLEVFGLSLHYHRQTFGQFDITLGNALSKAGYNDSFEKIKKQRLVQTQIINNSEKMKLPIILYPETKQIMINGEASIDLGGIVKGWSIQRLAKQLQHQWQITHGLVNAGGDIALWGGVNFDAPWIVGLENPWHPEKDIGYVHLFDGAIATSSKLGRSWQTQNGIMHHLIDPLTMKPSESDIVQVTVKSEDVTEAEIWAKVICISGLNESVNLIMEKQPKIEAVIFTSKKECIFLGNSKQFGIGWEIQIDRLINYEKPAN